MKKTIYQRSKQSESELRIKASSEEGQRSLVYGRQIGKLVHIVHLSWTSTRFPLDCFSFNSSLSPIFVRFSCLFEEASCD